MSCPQEALSALVDGVLSHGEREEVLTHLAGCASCRGEAEAMRAVKLRLSALGTATPDPSEDLLGRLRALAVPGVEPAPPRPAPLPAGGPRVAAAAPIGPAGSRPLGRPAGARPSSGPARSRRRLPRPVRRTGALGGSLLLLGVALALVLGAPSPAAPSTPVDPGSDDFVVDFVSTTGGAPLADPAGQAALLPGR